MIKRLVFISGVLGVFFYGFCPGVMAQDPGENLTKNIFPLSVQLNRSPKGEGISCKITGKIQGEPDILTVLFDEQSIPGLCGTWDCRTFETGGENNSDSNEISTAKLITEVCRRALLNLGQGRGLQISGQKMNEITSLENAGIQAGEEKEMTVDRIFLGTSLGN